MGVIQAGCNSIQPYQVEGRIGVIVEAQVDIRMGRMGMPRSRAAENDRADASYAFDLLRYLIY